MVFLLVGFDLGNQRIQPVTTRSTFLGAPESLDLPERGVMIGFGTTGFDLHGAPCR